MCAHNIDYVLLFNLMAIKMSKKRDFFILTFHSFLCLELFMFCEFKLFYKTLYLFYSII